MAYDTEEEQIEALRRWWRENGRSVIVGVVIAVVAVLGWQQWQAYQARRDLAAAAAYQEALAALQAEQGRAAGAVAALRTEHGGSPYATLASLQLARAQADAGDLESAAASLRWVVDNSNVPGLQALARLRLGQVLLAQGRLDDALATLDPVPEGAFAARYHELRGDVYAARKERDAAIAAYRAALEGDLSGQRRALVEVKLSDLGASAESSLDSEPVS